MKIDSLNIYLIIMKRTALLALLILASLFAFAQNTPAEKHLYKAFDAIKNNDVEGFKSLWPDKSTLSEIYQAAKSTSVKDVRDVDVYYESNYYSMLGKLLMEFLDTKYMNKDVKWDDLYIQQVHIAENEGRNEEGWAERSGYLWLKSNKDKKKGYVLPFADLLEFKGRWYGTIFRDVQTLDGSFDDFISKEEADVVPAVGEDTAAAVAAKAAAAALDAIADSLTANETASLPLLEQSTFSTSVNGKKMLLNWVVTGWQNDRYYNSSSYQYQDEDAHFFAEVVTLENGYVLLVDEDRKNFIRVENRDGNLIGNLFSTQSGKDMPLIFLKEKE